MRELVKTIDEDSDGTIVLNVRNRKIRINSESESDNDAPQDSNN